MVPNQRSIFCFVCLFCVDIQMFLNVKVVEEIMKSVGSCAVSIPYYPWHPSMVL